MTRRSLYTLVYVLAAVVVSSLTLLAEGLIHLHAGPMYAGAIATTVTVPLLLTGTWFLALRKIDNDAERHMRAGYRQCYEDVRAGHIQPGVTSLQPRKVSNLRDRLHDNPERNAT